MIRLADRILVMSGGRLVVDGAPGRPGRVIPPC
jgi:ABC-type multidrug transport system ATPase subunit